MANIEIRLNGTDITSDVIFADAEFTSMANGNVGTCSFRVRDLLHVYHTIEIGDEITLDIDGVRSWTGFVKQLNRGYFFEARDCECPDAVPIYYRVIGSDINVLLNQRYLFDPDNPEATDLQSFPAGTPDNEVIDYYVTNYLDLSGDGIDTSSLVEHVGTPSLDTEISGAVGMSWNQFMAFIAYNTGSIWYIDPDKKLVYCDVDTPNAPFEISDQPSGGQVGPREYTAFFDGTRLRNDALVWGAGKGSSDLVFARNTAETSVNTHGLWQVGRVVGGIWKEETAQRTADTYVDGSPQSKRGGKIDRHSVDAVLFEPGLRVAQKLHAYFEAFGYDEVIPIRVLKMDFPTERDVRWQITLAHEIDEPEDLTDPRPSDEHKIVCSIVHCGPQTDTSLLGLGAAGTGIIGPSAGSGGIGKREGSNDWHVSISHLCQPNNWHWTNTPDAEETGTFDQASVWVQWSDLYGYSTVPAVLCQKGEVGFEIETTTTQFKVPTSYTDESGVFHPAGQVTQWYGVAHIEFKIHGNHHERPWISSRPLFPFTHWGTFPLERDQLLAFGAINRDEYELKNEAIWPGKIITTEGTFQFREDGTSLFGERWAGYVTPEVQYNISVPLGLWPADANGSLYAYFPLVDFGNAAGIVWHPRLVMTTLWDDETGTPGGVGGAENRVYIEWFPAPGGGLGLRDPDDYASCTPRCITLGENCEAAERIGRRSYRVLGRYEEGSTRVSVNGISKTRGADYTESDPDNGVITFTYNVKATDYVFVCYTAYSIGNQIPAITPTDNILLRPIENGYVTGTFGPQPDFWPAEVWHGIYYDHFHNGVDYGVASGTPVYASADGEVVYETQDAGGIMIHIYHDSPATPYPMRTTYAHLSQRVVADGATVSQGDHIAYSGASGNVTGAHLHWGLVMYGWPEDPLPWSNTPRTETNLDVP